MLHEARQTFIHEEAKKLREKLNIEMNTPESFFIVKEILDRYDNASKLHQPTVIGTLPCDHEWIDIRSKHMSTQQCEKCGDYNTKAR